MPTKKRPQKRATDRARPQRSMRLYGASLSVFGLCSAAGFLAPQAASAQPEFHEGSSGPAVKSIQRALSSSPDGYFGPKTKQAVESFQTKHGLDRDGIVGASTYRALFASGGSHGSSASYHSSSHSSHSYSPTSGSGSGYAIPSYIVQCESRGNYRAVNPSTGAGGAYQIEPQTWRRFGGSGSPEEAPKAEQDQVAKRIYASQGSSPWQCAH